jgi:hypothetical protein
MPLPDLLPVLGFVFGLPVPVLIACLMFCDVFLNVDSE